MMDDKGTGTSHNDSRAIEDIAVGSSSCRPTVVIPSHTEVESKYVGSETRRVLGQENSSNKNTLKHSELISCRTEHYGERPPLDGQASSSSSDSVSNDETNNRENCDYKSKTPIIETDCRPNSWINVFRGSYNAIPVFELDEYNHQESTEEYSDLIHALQANRNYPRVCSPSSVSSVISSRPLEWDSGADVGYNQFYRANAQLVEPCTSPLEPLVAIGGQIADEIRPEATFLSLKQRSTSNIGLDVGLGHIKHTFKPIPKYSLRFPNAESSPLDTRNVDDSLPEVMISPIIQDEVDASFTTSHSNVGLNNKIEFKKPNKSHNVSSLKQPITNLTQLLIKDSDPQSDCCRDINKIEDGSNKVNTTTKQIVPLSRSGVSLEFDTCIKNKKLSSSLDDLSIADNEPVHASAHVSILSRSQSQTNIHVKDLTIQDNVKKHHISYRATALRNIQRTNKSASSSSVSTVVQKNRDLPFHSLRKSSRVNNESNKESGIRASDDKDNKPTKNDKICKSPTRTETPPLLQGDIFKNSKQISNYFQGADYSTSHRHETNIYGNSSKNKSLKDTIVHSTSCVLCPGAHKKSIDTDNIKLNSDDNQSNLCRTKRHNILGNNVFGNKARNSNEDRRESIGSLHSNMNNKALFGNGVEESIESSTASGACSIDNQSSVTAEDRVNSFEYLPGHIYNNPERQELFDSNGTSSISIHNQTSNNVMLFDSTSKSSKSTDSAQCNLEKDVQKGVDIISEFIRGSCASNSELKKKLLKRIVDRLITKNYGTDYDYTPTDLKSTVPWMSPIQPPNLQERNGRETRRSVLKSKVPCEFSSQSGKSASTNASSECFIPNPMASSTFMPSKVREATCKGTLSNSSTSEISGVGKKSHSKLPHVIDVASTSNSYRDCSKTIEESLNKPFRRNNWREPATKIEKLLEERKKERQSESSKESHNNAMTLVQYLNMEKENQLFWIRSGIQHLSNLKELLEKKEELKRGIKGFKARKHQTTERAILKDKNRIKCERNDPKPNAVEKPLEKAIPPTLNAWLERSAGASATLSSQASTENMESWTSHRYRNESNENLKSFIKRYNKKNSSRENVNNNKKDKVIYDEPPITNFRKSNKTEVQTVNSSLRPRCSQLQSDNNTGVEDGKYNACKRLANVAVQTSDCSVKCDCKLNRTKEDDKKQPVSYFITFDPPRNRSRNSHPEVLEEVSAPAKNEASVRNGVGCNNDEGTDSSDNASSRTLQRDKHTLQGGRGMLQYYLLRNRPSYVSWAEDRRQCIAQIQHLRELREQSKRRLLTLTEPRDVPLPGPPPQGVRRRVFSQQTMRRQTERMYRQLAEVKERQQDTKRKQGYRTNQLMADIFNKKLQKRVLKGEVNLSNSVSVISSI